MDSVCTYSFTGIDQRFTSDILLLNNGRDDGTSVANVLILSSNRHYTTSFEISNAAGSRIISGISFSKNYW